MQIKWFLIIIAFIYLTGCTHVYEPEVANIWDVKVEVSFIDPEFWPEDQQIRVGLFSEESSRTPIASVAINQPDNSDLFTVSIADVEEGDYTAQVYLTENSIYKVSIADLGSYSVYEDISEQIDAIQLVTFSRVQNQVFNNCIVCHGSSAGDIAADLNLTSGNSYENLVGITAEMRPEMVRVYAGSSTYSYLINVLNKDIDFNHAASSSATDADIQLVKDWIDEGALNN